MSKSVSILLFVFLLCSASHAGEEKFLVALLDFVDATPNKMSMMPDVKNGDNKTHLPEVMRVIRKAAQDSGVFELLPDNLVSEAMRTQIGKEAVARRYDSFSAVRLGKMLGVDAILTGEVVQFEKNTVPRDFKFTINGFDFKRMMLDDVVIRASLINAHNGAKLADVIGSGIADENLLEATSAVVENKLSEGFLQAVEISALKILRELGSADIKISKENITASPNGDDITNFTVVKTDGKYIYINAGYNKGVSIEDLFTILKKDDAGNMKPVAVCKVSMIESNASQLILVEPAEALGTILAGDEARRRTNGK